MSTTGNVPRWLGIILTVILALGLSRSVFLTVVMGAHFAGLAQQNVVRTEQLIPDRGVISDAKGKPLAMNIENNGKSARFYPGGEMTAALTGYVGQMNAVEAKNCQQNCPAGVSVGKAGLEKSYDSSLKGTPGEAVVEEDAKGKVTREIARTEAIPGENLKTNIDLEVQKRLYNALKKALVQTGVSAVGVVSRIDGEVLAMVSLPSYDPNLFVADGKRSDYGGDYKSVTDLLKDSDKKPLFDRAISGEFAPGSVFKPVTAMAGLSENKITRDTLIADTGEIVIGNYRYGNWLLDEYGRTEGEINVVKAIARSNDIFFYRVGEKLGVDDLSAWSMKLGLGKPTGIDLPAEATGLVPTQHWKEITLGSKWFLGDTYHFAIGQGNLLVTPIQLNRMTAAVLSGSWCPPRVAGRSSCVDLGLSKSNRQIVLDGMKEACTEGGTAYPLFPFGGKIYCKTGTAQHGGKNDLPHAWMTVVVPKGSDMKNWLVVTVLVESGGEGSAVAAPVTKEIMPFLLNY